VRFALRRGVAATLWRANTQAVADIRTMTIDDASLEAGRKELLDRIQKIDDLMLTVLKNHISLEQFMEGF
jgi:hypothetical protein